MPSKFGKSAKDVNKAHQPVPEGTKCTWLEGLRRQGGVTIEREGEDGILKIKKDDGTIVEIPETHAIYERK